MSSFFIRKNHEGAAHGPYALDKIENMLRNGLIGRDFVVSEDGEAWTPVVDLLSSGASSVQERTPPKISLGSAKVQPVSSPRLAVAGKIARPAPPPTSSQFEPQPPLAAQLAAPSNAGGVPPLKMYYMLPSDRNGDPIGPYKIDDLASMYRKGEVHRDSLVAADGDTNWSKVSDLIGESPVEPKPPSTALPKAPRMTNARSAQPAPRTTAPDLGDKISMKAWGRGEEITGWLTWLAFGCYISPIAGLVYFAKWFNDINTGLGGHSFEDLKFGFKAVIAFEFAVNLLIIPFSIWRLWLFFDKRRKFVAVNVTWFALFAACSIADAFFAGMLGVKIDSNSTNDLIKSILFALIWIPYTLNSKQVAKVFVR